MTVQNIQKKWLSGEAYMGQTVETTHFQMIVGLTSTA